jgi:hypothetical protein
MKTSLFWVGILLNIISGCLWGVLGIIAIIHVYGVATIWWLLGIWLIGVVLCYWPMFGAYLDYRKHRAAVGE